MFADTAVTVFVERDAEGNVKGVYRQRQPGYAEEEVLSSDAEVILFLEG